MLNIRQVRRNLYLSIISASVSIFTGHVYANTVVGWSNSLDILSTGNTINGFENTLTNSKNNNIGDKCNVVNESNGTTTTYCVTRQVNMTNSNNNTLTGSGNSTITNSNDNEFHMTGAIINNTNNTKTNGNNFNLNNVQDSDITGTYTNVTNGTNIITVGNHNNVNDSSDVNITGDYNTNDTGSNNTITGNNNYVYYGDNNVITGNTTTVIGSKNLAGSNQSTENAVAIGNNVMVDGVNSIGFGNNTIASNGGIAIGSGSNANRNDEVNIGDRNITGVKNGVANNDSINVGQLNETMKNTEKSANDYTDEKLQSGYTETNNYTDQRIQEVLNKGLNDFTSEYANGKIHQLNKKADKMQKHIYAGISSAIATASVPHREHKKYSFGVGVGSYRNEVSGALGVRVGLTKSIAIGSTLTVNTQNDTAIAVSFAYGF